MEKKFKLKPPIMPNFINVDTGTKLRQEGFASNLTIPINELSKDEFEEYAELIKETFIKHWENKTSEHHSVNG